MKATKKIVGAACALVAAVALSAGSTFAWFASSDKVTATGMKVQATVPTNLYIAKTYLSSVDAVNETGITYSADATELSPAAISNAEASVAVGALTGGNFYVLNPATWEDSGKPSSGNAGNAATYNTVDTLTVAGTGVTASDESNAWKNYLYKEDMTLANKSTDIDVSCTITMEFPYDADAKTYKFIRVGFVIGDGTTYTLKSNENKVGAAEATGVTYTEGHAANPGESIEAQSSKLVFEYNKLIENFEGNTLKTVSFLVWFDGDDTDCYVNNALTVSEFTIGLEYKATAVVAG